MDALDYPTRHFQEMSTLCDALKGLPAQLCAHTYSYESFGSWSVTMRCGGVRLRVVFDGRDREYLLQRSESRKSPDTWQEVVWSKSANTKGELPVSDILNAVRESAS